MKKNIQLLILMYVASAIKLQAQSISTNKNAIMEQTPREATTSLTGTYATILSNIKYFDGLGRPTQSIIYRGTPDANKDIISSTSEYDSFGRNYKNILPVASENNTGGFANQAQSLAQSFYNDLYPFTQVALYENSPTNRPLNTYGAGKNWRDNNKYTQSKYLIANSNEVLLFDVSSIGANITGTYGASQLYKNETISEQGNKTVEYTDKDGKTIQKNNQNSLNSYLSTLYIYDDFERLRYVIPPLALSKFGTATGLLQNFSETDDIFKEGIYGYHYDNQGRLTEKHIPGTGWTRYVYDKQDRIVLENDDKDANASPNYWKFSQYDALGRVIRTGLINNIGTYSRSQLQSEFDAVSIPYEERGSTLLGYTNRSFPSSYTPAETNIKTVNYYDDYTWQTETAYNFQPANAFHTQANTKGLQTGALVRNVETNDWYKSVNYYDYKGRVIQTFNQNHLGGIDRTDFQYRFNGDALATRITHKKTGANDVIEFYEYTYDHVGRKTAFSHNSKVVAKYQYDEIGRLKSKTFAPAGSAQYSIKTGEWNDKEIWQSGNLPLANDNVTINQGHIVTIPDGQMATAAILNTIGTLKNFGTLAMGQNQSIDLYTQSYKYHIRGGLKGINLDANNNLTSSLFSYKLDYEEDGTYYDGNIRNQYWKSNIDGIQRAYQYNYDGASRITAATYGSTKAGENYALNNVTYDANGNIISLSRNGATNTNYTSFGNVDNLNYTYQTNSNKLLKIQDATIGNPDLGDFRDGNITGNEYDYYADGSLKKDLNKGIDSIKYNYLKLVNRIKFSNGTWVNYQYDANGKKIKKVTSQGITTDYIANKIYENGNLYQTSHDEGRIVNGIYEYNITDHLGNLRVAFKDSAGIATPVQSLFYDPWGLSMKGMAITRNPTNFNKFQFLNRETQFETGYIDLIHRQFDPTIARFTSQDPVIEGQEHLSLYQYSWNNPILKSDPDGKEPCCGGVIDFVSGTIDAIMENNIPLATSYVNPNGSSSYRAGATTGHILSIIGATAEIITGIGGDATAAVGEVVTLGGATPVAVPLATGSTSMILHGGSTFAKAAYYLNSEGKKGRDKETQGNFEKMGKEKRSSAERMPKDAAKEVGVDSKKLGKAIHDYKKKNNMGGKDNLSWKELISLAKSLKPTKK